MKADDVDAGRVQGLTHDERAEVVELRRRNRVLEMEVENLKRACAFFARENVLPKSRPGWSVNSLLTGCPSRWPAGC